MLRFTIQHSLKVFTKKTLNFLGFFAKFHVKMMKITKRSKEKVKKFKAFQVAMEKRRVKKSESFYVQ